MERYINVYIKRNGLEYRHEFRLPNISQKGLVGQKMFFIKNENEEEDYSYRIWETFGLEDHERKEIDAIRKLATDSGISIHDTKGGISEKYLKFKEENK